MSEFDPLLQAQQDLKVHNPDDMARYSEWVRGDDSDQFSPEAATEFVKYLESRPTLDAKDQDELDQARKKIKDDKAVLVNDPIRKGFSQYKKGVVSKEYVNARKVIDKHNGVQEPQVTPYGHKSAGVPEHVEMYAELSDQELTDAIKRGDRTTAENLEDVISETGVRERVHNSLEQHREAMSMPAMARQLAKARHEGDTKLADDLAEKLFAKMEQHSKEKNLSDESQENLLDRIAGVEHRETLRLQEGSKQKKAADAKVTKGSTLAEDEPEAAISPEDARTDVAAAFDAAEPDSPEPEATTAAIEDSGKKQQGSQEPETTNAIETSTVAEPDAPSDETDTGTGEFISKFRVHSAEIDVPLHGQDSHINRPESGTFGVFDGMGGHAAGEVASRLAKEVFEESLVGYDVQGKDPEEIKEFLKDLLDVANDRIREHQYSNPETNGMGTTATVAKLVEFEDDLYLAWASVGDSRLYIQDSAGVMPRLVSTDDGYGSTLTNVLSAGYYAGVREGNDGVFKLSHRSRVMICSDGITGDTEDQFIDINDMRLAFDQPGLQTAADRLLELSTKPDDKTLVLFEVNSAGGKKLTDVEPEPETPTSSESVPQPKLNVQEQLREVIKNAGDDPTDIFISLFQKTKSLFAEQPDSEVLEAFFSVLDPAILEDVAKNALRRDLKGDPTADQISGYIQNILKPDLRKQLSGSTEEEPIEQAEEDGDEVPETPTQEGDTLKPDDEKKPAVRKTKKARKAAKKADKRKTRYNKKIATFDDVQYAQSAYGLSEEAARQLAASEKEVFLNGQELGLARLKGDGLVDAEEARRQALIQDESIALAKAKAVRRKAKKDQTGTDAEIEAQYDSAEQSIWEDFNKRFASVGATIEAIKEEYPSIENLEATSSDVADDDNLREFDPALVKRTPANRLRRLGRSATRFNRPAQTGPRVVEIDWNTVPEEVKNEFMNLRQKRDAVDGFRTKPEFEEDRKRLAALNDQLIKDHALEK